MRLIMFNSLVRSITSIARDAQPKRGWETRINGILIPKALSKLSAGEALDLALSLIGALREHDGVALIEIHNSSFGTLAYGKTSGGWDGWTFHEIGGGGSVVVPYFFDSEGMLYIGLAEQKRDLQGGMVRNVPRGFVDPGETHLEAAQREGSEEMSLDPARLKFVHLTGEGGNPNSAFFETVEEPGTQFFGFHVDSAWLEKGEKGYRFRSGLLQPEPSAEAKARKTGELILGTIFVPIHEATKVGDHFTLAGIARLFGHMMRQEAAQKASASRS